METEYPVNDQEKKPVNEPDFEPDSGPDTEFDEAEFDEEEPEESLDEALEEAFRNSSGRKRSRKKKGKGSLFLIILLFLAGAAFMAYPTVSDWWNNMHQQRDIDLYTQQAEGLDPEMVRKMLDACRAYNRGILKRKNPYFQSEEEAVVYEKLLNIAGNGMMGYVEIPKIKVTLPVYHGTSDGVLQVAVGHLNWTSLPVGGPSTHAVFSGHTGLPSAKLFTNINKLEKGDEFSLYILNLKLTYEVDQILTVLPEETQDLEIIEEEDYCTLVTCTPYGINTHRLLVRGKRKD